MLGASLFFILGKTSSKANILSVKGYILSQIFFFFLKKIEKNHKLTLQNIYNHCINYYLTTILYRHLEICPQKNFNFFRHFHHSLNA